MVRENALSKRFGARLASNGGDVAAAAAFIEKAS
jgi:hypothetical protein